MRLWLDAMWGIMRRDAILFVSYRTQLVAQIVSPLFAIAIFYYVSHLLNVRTFHSPDGYFGYVIVGLAIVEVLTVSLGIMPMTVRQELVSGTIERFLVSAHGPVNGILGTMLFPLCNSLLSGVLTLVLAAAVFGLPLATTSFLAVPVALLGVIAFMPFALLVVALVLAFKQVAGWIRWASDVQPFTPTTDLMRHLLVGTPLAHPAGVELLKLLGFSAVLLPAGFMLLRASIRHGQRTGTVAEY
jgi:hypothetical protein